MNKQNKEMLWLLGFLAWTCLVFWVGEYQGSHPPIKAESELVNEEIEAPTQKEVIHVTLKPLKIISETWYEDESGEFLYYEGEVKNVSTEPMNSVEAVAQYYDDKGTFIKSDSSLVEYNPIMPGQTSPFKVISDNHPMIKKGGVSFKFLIGGEIPTMRD